MKSFANVWLLDTEFKDCGGPRYEVHCVVAKNFHTGKVVRIWQPGDSCPIRFGQDALLVSYYSIAEVRSFLSLEWELPPNVLDLFTEFRVLTNGRRLDSGNSLLGAMNHFGLTPMAPDEKKDMRELAMRGAPFTNEESAALLDYCQSDVQALEMLLGKMWDGIDWPRALIRGEYMKALAHVEINGTPIDTDGLASLKDGWEAAKTGMIHAVDADYGVFDGQSFSTEKFLGYIGAHGIVWPYTDTGRPKLDDDTFRDLARVYPQLSTLRELRYALGQMRLSDLAVGPDGRNRCMLSPFRAITGRNQPSNAQFIFGPSVWIRNLIKPNEGAALAYVDYSQQEFGVGAALSGDPNMKEAYLSGDPYLKFAKQAGEAPPNATKKSHAEVREKFKVAALAVQYGMGEKTLGTRLGKSSAHGRELIELHKRVYPMYWDYIDRVRNRILFDFHHELAMGWPVHYLPGCEAVRSVNTLSNFPIQGNGAEMLRLAIILAVRRGIKVCAPVHDALLIEAESSDIEDAVALCQEAMEDASAVILNESGTQDGLLFKLRSDAKIVRWPDHYSDPRGDGFWEKLRKFIPELPA